MIKTTIIPLWSCQITAALGLLAGTIDQGAWYLIPAIITWTGLSLLATKINWSWLPSVLLISGCLMVGILCYLDFHIVWLLTATLLQLAAWDLLNLQLKFDQFPLSKESVPIMRVHFGRLGMVAFASFALVLLSMAISFDIPFGVTLLVGLIALIGLSLAFRSLRVKSQ